MCSLVRLADERMRGTSEINSRVAKFFLVPKVHEISSLTSGFEI